MRFSTRVLTLPVLAAFLSAMLATVSLAQSSATRSMTVTGIGEVSAEPDTADVQIGVTTEAATAAEALDKNTAAMTTVFDSLAELGIAENDLQTSQFNVNPVYERPEPNRSAPPKIRAYRVTNQVSATVRDLDNLGTVLDRVVSDGANQLNGVRFYVDEATEMTDNARKKAVADARRKAMLYAEAGGFSLGPVIGLSETQMNVPPPFMARGMAMEESLDASVPIARGEQTITARVHVTFGID